MRVGKIIVFSNAIRALANAIRVRAGRLYSILKRDKDVSGESYGMKLQKLFGKTLEGGRKGEMGWV